MGWPIQDDPCLESGGETLPTCRTSQLPVLNKPQQPSSGNQHTGNQLVMTISRRALKKLDVLLLFLYVQLQFTVI